MIIETCPECGADLIDICITTYPEIRAKQCNNCGWYWEEGSKEIERIPFQPPGYPHVNNAWIPPACRNCTNHPSNGGSGMCNCILGNLPIT